MSNQITATLKPCLIPIALSLLAACASKTPGESPAAAAGNLCAEPRPQICTADYRPVCASLNDGSLKTYANGCSACGDPDVLSWIENACSE